MAEGAGSFNSGLEGPDKTVDGPCSPLYLKKRLRLNGEAGSESRAPESASLIHGSLTPPACVVT